MTEVSTILATFYWVLFQMGNRKNNPYMTVRSSTYGLVLQVIELLIQADKGSKIHCIITEFDIYSIIN